MLTQENDYLENDYLEKCEILTQLRKFAHQRPGLEFGNYGHVKTYNAELRGITQDLGDFHRFADAVAHDERITSLHLRHAFKHAFSGRLTLGSDFKLSYTTGQYWPTEYRKAAAAVLLYAIREEKRGRIGSDIRDPGAVLRAYVKERFGRGIANRWAS